MKKAGLLVATATLVAMVSGTAWAHQGHHGDARDRDRHGYRDRGVSQQQVMREFLRAFDRMDRNQNGRIGYRELNRSMKHIRHGQNRNYRHDPYSRYGANRTPILNRRTFNRFDRNGDGYLYRRELRRGVAQAFRRADRNNNGYLGPREQREARWYKGGHGNGHNHRDRRDHDRHRHDDRHRH